MSLSLHRQRPQRNERYATTRLLLIAGSLLLARSTVRAKTSPAFSGPLIDALASRWQATLVASTIALAPHAQRIAVFTPQSGVTVYARSGKQIQLLALPVLLSAPDNLPTTHKDVLPHLQWSTDSKTLLLSTATGAFLWREQTKGGPATSNPSYALSWQAAAQYTVLSPDGGSIAYVLPTPETPVRAAGYTLYVQRLAEPKPLWKLFIGPLPMVAGQWTTDPRGLLWTAFASPLQTEFKNGSPIAHPPSPIMVVAWGAKTGRHEFQFEVPDADGKTLFFSGEGHNIVGFFYNTTKAAIANGLFRWDLSDGSQHKIAPNHEVSANSSGPSASLDLLRVALHMPLLVVAQSNQGKLFRVADGASQGLVSLPDSQIVSGVALAPDGDYLLITGASNAATANVTTFSLYRLRVFS